MRWEESVVQIRLDRRSGVPFYRQIIEQVEYAVATGKLGPGDQLPTVRQLAVELSINPNTVLRAYREMEIKGVLDTQQGSGTFVGDTKPDVDEVERERVLNQIVVEMMGRASRYGFSVDDVVRGLRQRKEMST